MLITALDPDPRGTGGVRVRVDGGPFATVGARDVAVCGLRAGRELTPAQARDLERRAEVFAARSVALRILGYRALPGREIVRRLARKGHAKPVAESVVAALEAEGLVDDAEFARHYARTRASRKRLGAARLKADLRRLGVDDRLASQAVEETLAREGIDSRELLREAAARKLVGLRGTDAPLRRRRLKVHLMRRGFSSGDIAEYLRHNPV